MSPGLGETVDGFEGSKHGKKKKKNNVASPVVMMSQNSEETKKNRKKKNSLSSDAPELSESFAELLGDKQNEKKKKHKKKLLSALDTQLNESLEDAFEGKKKKKKKRNLTPDETGLSQESLVNMADSPPKKKKKKSGGQENLSMLETEESGPDSPVKHKPDVTPKHKKKKGKIDDVIDSVKSPKEENDPSSPLNVKKSNKKARLRLQGKESSNRRGTSKKNGYVDDLESYWSVEEELTLIDSVLGNLDPKDNAPFRTSLRKIDWKNAAITDRSPEECSEMLDKMISKISKYKTLTMILQEVKEEVSDGHSRLRRILSPRSRFILDYCKKHASEVPSNLLRVKASAAWSELSGEGKKHYKIQYEKEVEELKKRMDLPPDVPKSPFELYYSSEMEKEGSKGAEPKSNFKKLFSDMKMEDKSQYILESCREVSRCLAEYRSYKESHPDFDKPMPKISGLKLYKEYFEFIGMPKNVNSVVSLFFDEMNKKGKLNNLETKNKLMSVNSMYSELSDEEKAKYKAKSRKAVQRYKHAYKVWKDSLSEDVALFLETYIEKQPRELEGIFGTKHTVEVCMAKPKFNSEPEKPAGTPYRLFSIKFRKQRKDKYSSAKEMEKACSSAWRSLPAESHSKYHERCLENREIYKASLLEYVRSLGDVAKMYLGFKRKEHYNFFKEDIFEEEFPVEEYPIYIVTKKEVGTLKGVVKAQALREEGSKVLKSLGIEHSNENHVSSSESSDEDTSDSDHEPEKSVPNQRDLQRTAAKESNSEDDDEEEDEEDDEEEDEGEEDDDGYNITQAWESPNKSHQNADSEDDDESEDDDSE
ncbi:nucleolar transcription factor 1-A-like isoform X3 [Macrobrachium rosenbergii]